jgi:Arc/MetJ family transcription regulator
MRLATDGGVPRPSPEVGRSPEAATPTLRRVIFKRVGEGRPYPEHGLTQRDWAALPPTQVRLDDLVTTKDQLDLATLLDEDSTFFGDLFAHVIAWRGELYLEDGLHRALRAALHQRLVLHARVYDLRAGGL